MDMSYFFPSDNDEKQGLTTESQSWLQPIKNFFSKKPSSSCLPATQEGAEDLRSAGSSRFYNDFEMLPNNAIQKQKFNQSYNGKYQDSSYSFQFPNSNTNFNRKDSDRAQRYIPSSRHSPSNFTQAYKRISPNLSRKYVEGGFANQDTHKNADHMNIHPNLSKKPFTPQNIAKSHVKPNSFTSDVNAHVTKWQNNSSSSHHGTALKSPKFITGGYISPNAKDVLIQQRNASGNQIFSPQVAPFVHRDSAKGNEKLGFPNAFSQQDDSRWSQMSIINLSAKGNEKLGFPKDFSEQDDPRWSQMSIINLSAKGNEKLGFPNDFSQQDDPRWSQMSIINLNAEEEAKKLFRGARNHQTGEIINKGFASGTQESDVENIDIDTSLSQQSFIKLSVSDEKKQPHKSGKNKQLDEYVGNMVDVCDDRLGVHNHQSGNGSSNAHLDRLINKCSSEEEDSKIAILRRRLQEKLKTDYEKSMKRNQSLWTTNKCWDVLFGPFLRSRNKSHESASFIELMSSSLKEGSNTLLVGEPGFGKTTLCSMMTYKWAISFPLLDGFELCLVLPCKNLSLYNGESIGSKLVAYCSSLVGERKSDDNFVMKALFGLRMKTLLILEDYDECEQSYKELIKEFLERKGILQGATVFVTTRPLLNEHDLFDQRLNMVLELGGYSNATLKSLLVFDGRYHNSFRVLDDDRKFHYLTGMTPRFTTQVSKAVPLIHNQAHRIKNRSLYHLIDYVLDSLWSGGHVRHNGVSFSHSRESRSERIQLDLGKLFFEALLTRRYTFSESLLKDVLKEGFQNIVDCQIIIKAREYETDQVWFPATKLWMVFFATKYLKHLWGKCKTNVDRTIFLNKVLCCGAYNGEFVFSKKVYYVGVMPEIILSFGDGSSLDKANVEMFYDVERIECSQAFDSINMLLRVDEKYFSRYNFEKCSEGDLKVQRIFESVLSNSNGDVMFEFYRNAYENRYFLHGTITNGNGDSILSAIYRAKDATEIDRVYIHFCSFYLASVFSSLKNMLSKYVPESDLSESLIYRDVSELIYDLTVALNKNLTSKPSIVSWGYQPESTSNDYKRESSLKIIPKNTEQVIQYSTQCFSRDLLHSESEYYSTLQFEDEKQGIIGKIMGSISKNRKPFVAIDFFLCSD